MDLRDTICSAATPYDENTYATIAKALENSYIEFSFWGEREIYAVGYEGSITLEELALKIVALAKLELEIVGEERENALLIEKKIKELHKISEHQIDRANWITLFFYSFLCLFDNAMGYADMHYTISNTQNYNTIDYFRDPANKISNKKVCV